MVKCKNNSMILATVWRYEIMERSVASVVCYFYVFPFAEFPQTLAEPSFSRNVKKKRGKTLPVTGRGGPSGCETSRPPHFLDSWLTDGGEVISLTCQPSFTPRKIPGTHFC
jgi:hypothetical protein